MTATIEELKNLILQEKIDDAIAFLKEHAEALKAEHTEQVSAKFYGELFIRAKYNNFAHFILFWLAEISADFYLFRVVTVNALIKKENDHKQVLWDLWTMEHPEFNSYIQWLPQEVLSDTIELLPLHRLIDLLVKYGADLNVQEISRNLLYQAAYRGNGLMMRLLIEHGANINLRDKDGRNIFLHFAVQYDMKQMLYLFLLNGVDINLQDKYGYTPLFNMIKKNNMPMVNLALQYGMEVNISNNYGSTPLCWAIYQANAPIVRLLLQKGANVNTLQITGEPLLFHPIRKGNESMVGLLLKNGADVNVADESCFGNTALHLAVHFNYESIVSLLLKKGADIDAQDKDGNTPLHSAKILGHESIVKLLLEASNAKKKVEQPIPSTHSNVSLSSSSGSNPSSSSNSDLRASSNPHLVYQTLNASPRVPNANNSKDEQDSSEKKCGPGSSK